jgi:hypothetical protein
MDKEYLKEEIYYLKKRANYLESLLKQEKFTPMVTEEEEEVKVRKPKSKLIKNLKFIN